MEARSTFSQIVASLVLVLAVLVPMSAQAAPVKQVQSAETVNVNTAEAAQLAYLPRIGPALAERIVAFRKENGELKSPGDLILVRGIGEKTFKNLEPFVTVEGKTTLSRKLRAADVEAMRASIENQGEAPKGEE